MRKLKASSFGLPEFASALASLAILSLVLHPVIASARTGSGKPSSFRPNSAFQMYAADVDGGFGDFEGKAVLVDGLKQSLARYGDVSALHAHKSHGGDGMTGCMPILRFEPSSYIAEAGSLTYWQGKVGGAASGCSVYPAVAGNAVLDLPSEVSVPTDGAGNFTLVAGTLQEGIGTMGVITETGAVAVDSVLVVNQ